MGGILGIKRPAQRAADAAVALQGQVAAQLNDMKTQITELRKEVVEKLIPEVTQTLDVARDSLQTIVNTTQRALERFSKTLDKVDETVVTVKFGVEVILIILFLLIAMICRYELNRINSILRPNAFYRMEVELLHLLRLACIFSGLALVGRVFYILILQRSEATPNELLLLALLPILAILVYKILCLLILIIEHVFSFLRFALWAPFMVLIYPVFYISYLTFIAPSVWLYRVYKARFRLPNQYAIYVMHSFAIILPLLCLEISNAIMYFTAEGFSPHLSIWYALIATYIVYYLIALYIKLTYPVHHPQKQVRQVYALRYPQQFQRRY